MRTIIIVCLVLCLNNSWASNDQKTFLLQINETIDRFITVNCPKLCLGKNVELKWKKEPRSQDLGFQASAKKTISGANITLYLSNQLKRTQRIALSSLLESEVLSRNNEIKINVKRKLFSLPLIEPAIEPSPLEQYHFLLWPFIALFSVLLFAALFTISILMYLKTKKQLLQRELAFRREEKADRPKELVDISHLFARADALVDKYPKETSIFLRDLEEKLERKKVSKEQYQKALLLLSKGKYQLIRHDNNSEDDLALNSITKKDLDWIHLELHRCQRFTEKLEIANYSNETLEEFFFSSNDTEMKAMILKELDSSRWFKLLNQLDSTEKIEIAKLLKQDSPDGPSHNELLIKKLDTLEKNIRSNIKEDFNLFLTKEERSKISSDMTYQHIEDRLSLLDHDQLSELILAFDNHELSLLIDRLGEGTKVAKKVLGLIPKKRILKIKEMSSSLTPAERDINIQLSFNKKMKPGLGGLQ